MRVFNSKSKRIVAGIIGALVIIFILLLVFSSVIAKYLIEKYDVKYTGREIKLDNIYVNFFTGNIYISNLQIREQESDSIFLSAKSVKATLSIRKLFHGACEISELTLNQAKGIIIETPEGVNYKDLVERFRSKDTIESPSSFHINILNIKINDGVLTYRETTIPIDYSAIHLNIESPGFGWNMDTLAAKVSLVSGNGGGEIAGAITINLKNMDYSLNAAIDRLELKFLEQYFKMISNYGSFRANLDADLKVNGNFRDAENLNATGKIFINDFHFGEAPGKDFAAFEKFALTVNNLNPKNKTYLLDSVSLSRPYFKYERYDYLDNVQRMFGAKGNVVSSVKDNPEQFNLILVIGDYIKTIALNFFKSNYKVNRIAIYNGNFKYADYSLNEMFSIEANPLVLVADSIRKNKSRANFYVRSGIKPYGNASLNFSISPTDSSDFDLTYSLKKLPIALFNPYLISHTSFPLNRGTLEVEGKWKVRGGILQSTNHLLTIDPRVGRRIRNRANRWLPLGFIMFFIRDEGNVMDYQIPINGNIKSPKFHYGNIVLNIVKNIFVKPATTVYRTKVKIEEEEIENSIILKWGMHQISLTSSQSRFLRKLAVLMGDSSMQRISVYPMPYTEKEKEYILLFEAKKRFFLASHHLVSLSKKDSVSIDRMSNKDSLFVRYLNKMTGKQLLFTVQDKCIYLLGVPYINSKYNQLNELRKKVFNSYFTGKSLLSRISFSSPQNNIPYNGYSYYKIIYKGVMPASLTKAYLQMNKYDVEPPRKKYKEERDKNKAYSE